MSNEYTTSVLYKADLERELQERETGINADDYALIDCLCTELKSKLKVECSWFQDLRYKMIVDDFCIPVFIKYIPLFSNIGFAQEIITQQFGRKGNTACSDFLEQWTLELKSERKLTKVIENTLDNAFVKIQDRSKIAFYTNLIREKDSFPFIMELLGKWKVKAVLPIIIKRLDSDAIKTSAIKALGNYKDISLLPYIQPFLNNTKIGERKVAEKFIK